MRVQEIRWRLLSSLSDGNWLLLRHHLDWLLGHGLDLGHRQRHGGVSGHRLSSLEFGSGKLLWDLLLRQRLLGNCSSISSWQRLSSTGDLQGLSGHGWLQCLYCWIRECSLRRGGWHLGLHSWLLGGVGLGDWLLGNGWLSRSARYEIGLWLLARCRLVNGLGWLSGRCGSCGLRLGGL